MAADGFPPSWMMLICYGVLLASYLYRRKLEPEISAQLTSVALGILPSVLFYLAQIVYPPTSTLIANNFILSRTIKRTIDLVFVVTLIINSPIIPMLIFKLKPHIAQWRRHGRPRR